MPATDASTAPADGATQADATFAAVLARWASEQGVVDDGDAQDASAAAVYLKPFLDRLTAAERAVGSFPESPGSGPWAAIEAEVLDPRTRESVHAIGQRHGVRKRHLYAMSKRRKWPERRAILLELQARQTTAASLVGPGRLVEKGHRRVSAEDNERRLLNLIDRCLRVFEVGLEKGQVQLRSVRDLDILVRLAKFVQGHAEKIVERRDRITPGDLERRAARIARRLNLEQTLSGVVTDAEFAVVGESENGGEPPPSDADETDADVDDQNGGPSSSEGSGEAESSTPDSSPRSSASQ